MQHIFLDPKDTHYAFIMRCTECTVNMSFVCVQLNTTRHLQGMLNTNGERLNNVEEFFFHCILSRMCENY